MNTATSDLKTFSAKLGEYKEVIDEDIAKYSKHIQHTTLQQYGKQARLETDAFLEILSRGGKRIRGALVMLGYEMSGGTDRAMIVQAARAVEMLHAYILIIDDIQDRSPLRRGGPTAHMLLADYHRQHHLADEAAHFGIAIALNAALAGAHAAEMILANLEAPQELRLNVLSIMNRTMMVTAHGQTSDIMNEVTADVTIENIEKVLEWKTACYTLLNPLHVGMVFAGADCHATDAITPYAMAVGKAFQLTDDVVGIFGSTEESGKSPLDDIREGKRTILMAYALEHADKSDRNFLIQMLGNRQLKPAEFERCKAILLESGAVKHTKSLAEQFVHEAQQALDKEAGRWSNDGIQFLHGLADYLLNRSA